MTGISSVWSFVNQKVVTQFPRLLSRFQRISFLSALQGFHVNKLSFVVGIIWQQDFLSLWNDIAAFIQAKFCCFNNANLVWQGFIRTSQIYRSECQKFTWTKPIYCSGWQGSSRTCHPCRLETSLFKWLLFSVWSSSCQVSMCSTFVPSTRSQSVELG